MKQESTPRLTATLFLTAALLFTACEDTGEFDLNRIQDPDASHPNNTDQEDKNHPEPDTHSPDMPSPNAHNQDTTTPNEPEDQNDPEDIQENPPDSTDTEEEPDSPEPIETPPTRYQDGEWLSPITPHIAERLQNLHQSAHHNPDPLVFMKVGDSGTVSKHFMHCFADPNTGPYHIDLNGRDDLEDTLEFFRMGDASDSTPFHRESLAAKVGRSANWATNGNPSPLEQEIEALNPGIALVSYGTNDMHQRATPRAALRPFYTNMHQLLSQLHDHHIIPVITGLPPRAKALEAERWVPTYNTVTRGMAEALQTPYIDLYNATHNLDNRGLVRDGIHGNAYRSSGSDQPCILTEEGLEYGYNVRNLLTLQQLDAVRRTVFEDQTPSHTENTPLQGSGTLEDPYIIDQLPFTHAGNTRAPGLHAHTDNYPSCDNGQDESGPEVIYRLNLPEDTPLRALVLDLGGVDIDIHQLDETGRCTHRDDYILENTLEAGQWLYALDTFQDQAGAYLFVLQPCEPGDPDCQ